MEKNKKLNNFGGFICIESPMESKMYCYPERSYNHMNEIMSYHNYSNSYKLMIGIKPKQTENVSECEEEILSIVRKHFNDESIVIVFNYDK